MPPTYQHFTTLDAANAYIAAQTALMNLPAGGVTTSWTAPILLTDGNYAVQAYQDAAAIPWQSSWAPRAPGQ
jgi:hypothetical protein